MSIQNSINAPTPFKVSKGGTGNSTELLNNQVWLGNTGNPPIPTTLTPGNNISLVNTSGVLTINASNPANIIYNYPIIADVNPMIAFNAYIINLQANINFYLPSIANVNIGDIFIVQSRFYLQLFTIHAGVNQQINWGDTPGTSIASSIGGSSIALRCFDKGISPYAIFNVESTNGQPFTIS